MSADRIIREKREVECTVTINAPECHLTDDELEQHVQGIANVLFFLIGVGLSNAPMPFQPATWVVAKVKKPNGGLVVQ